MFRKGDAVEYRQRREYVTGFVIRDQVSEIVEVDFGGLEQDKYRAFYYNLKLVEKKYEIKLKDSLFDI